MSKQNQSSKQNKGINAKEVVIKFIDGPSELLSEYSTSSLFKVYLKSLFLNKTVALDSQYQITFLNKSITYKIIQLEAAELSSSLSQEEIKNQPKELNVVLSTQLTFDLSFFQIDSLANEFNSKLKINSSLNELTEDNKAMLKGIINTRLSLNKSSLTDINQLDQIFPVNYETEYEKIMNVITLQFNDNKTNDILINKSNYINYSYKGILLTGSSGIGKTHLINCIKKGLKEKNVNYFVIDIFKESNENDKDKGANLIRLVFKFAKILSPSVIIIESIDSLFPKLDDDSSSSSSLLESNPSFSIFINELDQIQSNCFVISSCINLSKVNSEILKHNRLDYSIQLIPPNYIQRKALIEYYAKDFNHNFTSENIDTLADKSHGFVPGDIIKLFKEAYLSSLITNKDQITFQLIQEHLSNIKPINLKDIIIDIPKVLWSEIGGNKEIIEKIRQSIEWPLKNPEAFKRLGISPPNGTLLYGPPGCSKTMIAKALATESGLNFFAVKGPELFSKYVGDTEKAVRDIFKKAKISSPSIIFFDEIDSMASQRGHDSGVEDKVLCQLLNEMDGIEGREKVVIFGATNRPDILDKALIRPGRFDRLIYIPPPDEISRKEIFSICLSKMKIADDVDINELVSITAMFSGADISKVCREAGMLALSEDINAESISKNNLICSIKQTKPIITNVMISYFEAFSKNKEDTEYLQ